MAWFGRGWRRTLLAGLTGLAFLSAAHASPALVVDVDSGAVLYENQSTAPWFPASLTKLMTTYVALSAVREGRISLDTPLMVSQRAARMAPSKMGFRPGTLVTLDNALKMLMVKSPNDVAVTIAEGVGGTVEAFADEMNSYGAKLGLHESHFVNPNGLPDPAHVSSARDMAIIARALLREFPEQHDLFGIGVLAFGNQLIRNHNGLLGRYAGIDGMKTGYTCSAGYNVVLSAERDNRHLVTVVLGAPSNGTRSQRAVSLFDRYFASGDTSGPQLGSLPSSEPAVAPDLRSVICGRGRAGAIAEAESEDAGEGGGVAAALPAGYAGKNGAIELANTAPATTGPRIMSLPQATFTPVRVFIGPVAGWTGPIARPKDMDPATVATSISPAKLPSQSLDAGPSGPIESPSPAPLALVGATAPLPATLMTDTFARGAKTLPMSVHTSRRKRGPTKADREAQGTTPSLLAADAAEQKQATSKGKTAAPASKTRKAPVKALAKPKTKPKAGAKP